MPSAATASWSSRIPWRSRPLDELKPDALNSHIRMAGHDAALAAFVDFARAETSTAALPNGYEMSEA